MCSVPPRSESKYRQLVADMIGAVRWCDRRGRITDGPTNVTGSPASTASSGDPSRGTSSMSRPTPTSTGSVRRSARGERVRRVQRAGPVDQSPFDVDGVVDHPATLRLAGRSATRRRPSAVSESRSRTPSGRCSVSRCTSCSAGSAAIRRRATPTATPARDRSTSDRSVLRTPVLAGSFHQF